MPNERGLDRALKAGCAHVAVFASATETFAARNLNSTVADQMTMFAPVVRRALDAGADVRAYVSMCFGDPWEGPVDPDAVVRVGCELLELGATQLSLGDTIGVGTAAQVGDLVRRFGAAGVGAAGLGGGVGDGARGDEDGARARGPPRRHGHPRTWMAERLGKTPASAVVRALGGA